MSSFGATVSELSSHQASFMSLHVYEGKAPEAHQLRRRLAVSLDKEACRRENGKVRKGKAILYMCWSFG